MKRSMNPRIMLIISMTVFGTLGLFVRNIALPSGELALYRAILAALLIAAFLFTTKQKIPFHEIKKEIPLLLLSGIAMGFTGYCFLKHISTLPFPSRLSATTLPRSS